MSGYIGSYENDAYAQAIQSILNTPLSQLQSTYVGQTLPYQPAPATAANVQFYLGALQQSLNGLSPVVDNSGYSPLGLATDYKVAAMAFFGIITPQQAYGNNAPNSINWVGNDPLKVIQALYNSGDSIANIQAGLQSAYKNISNNVSWDAHTATTSPRPLGTISMSYINSYIGTAADSATSLQRSIELSYVGAANQILYSTLQPLQDYLSQTQQAIDILADIQNMRNSATVIQPKGNFLSGTEIGSPIFPGGPPASYVLSDEFHNSTVSAQRIASEYFMTPIKLSVQWKYADVNGQIQNDFNGWSSTFYAQMSKLSTLIPLISANTPAADRSNPNGLLATLKTVYNNLRSTNMDANGVSYSLSQKQTLITDWLTDGNNTSAPGANANAGVFARNITTALTAAENLNSSQVASVRNYLLVFEEYYKSAAAVLQQITQIINRIAQNISR